MAIFLTIVKELTIRSWTYVLFAGFFCDWFSETQEFEYNKTWQTWKRDETVIWIM